MKYGNGMKRSLLLSFFMLLCVSAFGWQLRGTLPGCTWDDNTLTFSGTGSVLTCTVNVETTGTYEFKMYDNGGWYGNNGTMTAQNCTGWTMSTSEGANCKIEASVVGEYLFSFDTNTKKLSVTYPQPLQTGWFLAADFTGWGSSTAEFVRKEGDVSGVGYLSLNLEVGTYEFKVKKDDTWNGLDNKKITATERNIQLGNGTGGNITLVAGVAGVYQFEYDVNSRKISVIYPAATTYTVTVEHGTASSATVDAGGSVTLTAETPADCERFAGWTLTGVSVADLTANPLTVNDVQADIVAVANFEAMVLPTIDISLSASVVKAGSSVTATPSAQSLVAGISYVYQYKMVAADVWTDVASNAIVISESGSYFVRAKALVAGCTQAIFSSEVPLTVEPAPAITIRGNFPAAWFTTNSGTPSVYYWGGGQDGKHYAMTYVTTETDGSQWYSFELPAGILGFKFSQGNWNWQSNNDLTRPLTETCYQLEAANNRPATVRSCPELIPTLTLSSSEGTSMMVGSTTILTVATANFPGEVTYTIYINDAPVSNKNSYTWTPDASGDFVVRVEATNGTLTLTETLSINVSEPITIYFRRPKGNEGFGAIDGWTQGVPEAYVAVSYTDGEYYFDKFAKSEMTFYMTDDDDYEWYYLDNVPKGAQLFFFDGDATHVYDNRPYYNASTVLVVATAQTCYSIQNQMRNDPNRFALSTDICPESSALRYRLCSVTRDGRTFYSNVGHAGDTLSVYLAGALSLQKYDGGWIDTLKLAPAAELDSMLIIATLANGIVSIEPYVGDIYVRTDGATGGWNNYICDDNAMVKWAPNRALKSEYYDYYWVRWLGQNQNLKAVVANRFNANIANEVGDMVIATAGANTRFAYDSPSNRFYRNMIGGAGTHKFLEITEVKNGDEHLIYMDTAKNDPVAYQGNDGRILTDVSNWNYYIDTYCYPGATVHMEGTQADAGTQVLVDSLVVLQGETFPTKPYRVRLIYLFAQNRIIHAWLPDGDVDENYDIGSGVLFVREDDKLKNSLSMLERSSARVLAERIYMCLEINKENWKVKKKAEQQVYFFSLPYSCKIEDIYGSFDKTAYGTKWIIQRYRGDLRARYGLVGDKTYWATMKPTATLEANRGYVLLTNFQESDFKEGAGVSQLRFYFPSEHSNFEFYYKQTAESTLESYPCTINIADSLLEYGHGDRRQLDNDWHVIGIPGFLPMQVEHVDFDPTALNYVYQYTMRTSSAATPASQYALYSTAEDFVMEPFFAYFVQYAGVVGWNAYTNVSPRVFRRTSAGSATERYPITLSNNSGGEDRMYVTLSDDGSLDFESGRDVLKMLTTGYTFPQLYALADGERFGALDLPDLTQTVRLGIYCGTDDHYTLSLASNATQQAYSVMLHDTKLNIYHNLMYGDYTFECTTGTDESRFEIVITKKSDVVTEQPELADNGIAAFAFAGGLMVTDLKTGDVVRLFDAVGRLVAAEQSDGGQTFIGTLRSGIYVLVVESASGISTQKVVVN